MDIVKIDISLLNPAPYNPRLDLKPTDSEYIKLKKSIQEFGCVEPIVVNKRNNVIVGGHQRYKVLKDLGYKDIDVVYVDLDDIHEKSLNIALNKISGDWDADKLEDLLREINLDNSIDTILTGFDNKEIDKLLGSLEDYNLDNTNDKDNNNEDNNNKELENQYELIIECSDEKDMQEKYELLQKNNIDCRISTI
jgi:ParB-like chromosome segregation protein Spo0J